MEERTGLVIMIIGSRKSGKTTLGKSLCIETQKANPQLYILVVDDIDHPDYREESIITINPDMIGKIIEPRSYRIIEPDTKETMKHIRESASNCIILMEDASKYFDSKLTADQKATILNTRQRGCDVILMFHTYADVPPRLFGYCDFIYIKKTVDDPKRFKNSKIPSLIYDELVKGDAIVKRSKNRFEKYPIKVEA